MREHALAEAVQRALAMAGAGAACAAGGLLLPGQEAGWAAGTLAVAGFGAWRLGPTVLLAALPAIALAGGGWAAWAGWTAAATASVCGLALWNRRRDEERHRPIRRELRDAEQAQMELERHLHRFPVLINACLALSGAREHDQYAALLVEHARALAPEAREVLVFLGLGGAVDCRASATADGSPCPRPPGEIERYVASEARSLVRRSPGEVHLAVPLRADRRTVDGEGLRGVLSVRLAVGTRGDRVATELIAALAQIGGIALAAVDLVDQARAMALHDDLTGLLGRHEFLRRLDERAAHARRAKGRLALLLCDMDHLKDYNDRFGHPAGDAALRGVAKTIAGALPLGGLACRWGGEEFCACAPVEDPAELAHLGEALRAAIAGMVPDPQHPERRVTASVGITLIGNDEDGSSALDRADRACYAAKSAGRNRVEVAS